MTVQDILLNIAVNLGRLGRFAQEKKNERIIQFMADTQMYVDMVDDRKLTNKIIPTWRNFYLAFDKLKSSNNYNDVWAEEAFTWANILTHRAKLT